LQTLTLIFTETFDCKTLIILHFSVFSQGMIEVAQSRKRMLD